MNKKKSFAESSAHLDSIFFDGGEPDKKTPAPPKTRKTQGTHKTHETRKTQGTYKTHETRKAQETHETHETHKSPKAQIKYYRFNLKLREEFKEYLEKVSWENHLTITQYINNLVETDAKRTGKAAQ